MVLNKVVSKGPQRTDIVHIITIQLIIPGPVGRGYLRNIIVFLL